MSLPSNLFHQHLPKLEASITKWQASHLLSTANAQPPSPDDVLREEERLADQKVILCVRTRPFLPLEIEAQAAAQGKSTADGKLLSSVRACDAIPQGKIVVHVPISRVRGPSIETKEFQGDISLGESDGNDEAYEKLVKAPKLLQTVLNGGMSCLLAYGQTGSGKTYTVQALQHRIASDLISFSNIHAATHFPERVAAGDVVYSFKASCFELLGNNAWDLLGEEEGAGVERRKVDIAEDVVGAIRTTATLVSFTTTTSLLSLISLALTHRRTSPTLKNATSSRSHCIFTIHVQNDLFPGVEPGRLVLVDLAGSERAADRKEHGTERLGESRLINQSLSALKDCVRARSTLSNTKGGGAFLHVPYRSSKLTLALKPVFDLETRCQTKTVIIAHVSPHLADAAHSTNTLNYVQPFRVPPIATATSPLDPRTWSHEEFKQWVAKNSRIIDPNKLAHAKESGKVMAMLPESEWIKRVVHVDSSAKASEPPSSATVSKLYMMFWKMVVKAKEIGKSESSQDRMLQAGPISWTYIQLCDWLADLVPKIDVDIVAPFTTKAGIATKGKVLMEEGEAVFITRMVQAAVVPGSIDEAMAKEVWKRLWDMSIAALNGDRKKIMKRRQNPISSAEEEILQVLENVNNVPGATKGNSHLLRGKNVNPAAMTNIRVCDLAMDN